MSRCVRRAYLCGRDPHSGRDFDHRKPWLVDRLKLLSSIFPIDVCAYAIMSNHFHVVLRVDQARAASWSGDVLVKRYGRLFRSAKAQLQTLSGRARAERLELWRGRLSDLSWFM